MASGYNVNVYCEDYTSYLDRKLSRFDVDSFLKQYPEPDSAFVEPRVSYLYSQHVQFYLYNRFPAMTRNFIDKAIQMSGPRLQQVYKFVKHVDSQDMSTYTRTVRPQQSMPAEVEEVFYDELLFILHREEIVSMDVAARISLQERYEAAKHSGELVTCPCCFEDIVPEEQVMCASGHGFCQDCLQKSMEVALGQGRKKLTCLQHSCTEKYTLTTVADILKPNTFACLTRRMRDDDINDSMGIESCPYCLWPCDMAEVDSTAFRCPNPDCLRDSCRLCRGPDHSINNEPCKDASPPDLRTYLMDAVSEAVMRTCERCDMRIMKDGGCNLMSCVCGASFCFVCRKAIDGYDHFQTSRCMLFDGAGGYNETRQQQRDIRRAVEEAIGGYRRRYPEAPKQEVIIDKFLASLGKRGEEHGGKQERAGREQAAEPEIMEQAAAPAR